MSSTDQTNQLFWLNYAEAIKEKAGANFGDSGAFFLASEAQKGPVAGSSIPDEYTNQGMYDIGNNLLATDNFFYNPSALHGYVEALNTFLNWVDLGGKPDAGLDAALYQALQDQKAAQDAVSREQQRAVKQYKQDVELGMAQGQNFYEWVSRGNAPGYNAATQQRDNIGSTIQQIQSRMAGPMASTINSDRSKLQRGLDELSDFPGYNMHGALGSVLSDQELTRMFNSGDKIPTPTFNRLPAYNAPQYKQLVQAAMRKAGNDDYQPQGEVEFSMDNGKNTSDFNFGQTSGGASVGVSWGPWFSFNAGGKHSSESSTLDTSSESSQVHVKITYDTMQCIPITPGQWNIDVSKYKLRSDAPNEVKTLARVSQLVVATRLGYEITVGSQTAHTVDTKMKESTSAGGGISIFGIPINLGGEGSHSEEHDSHTATWDNASQTVTVKPISDVGFATVVGVVGEKFSIL